MCFSAACEGPASMRFFQGAEAPYSLRNSYLLADADSEGFHFAVEVAAFEAE